MNKYLITMMVGSLLLAGCSQFHKSSAAPVNAVPARTALFDGATLKAGTAIPRSSRTGRRYPRRHRPPAASLFLPPATTRLPAHSEITAGQREEPPGGLLLGESHAGLGDTGIASSSFLRVGGMWDYHPGKKGPPREKLPHPDFDPHLWHETEILAHLKTGTIRMAVDGVEVTRYTRRRSCPPAVRAARSACKPYTPAASEDLSTRTFGCFEVNPLRRGPHW